MPRLLRVLTRLNVGGPARQVCYLHEELQARGWECHLIHGRLDKGEGDFSALLTSKKGVFFLRHLCRPLAPWQDLLAMGAMVIHIWRFNPELVHTHTAKAGWSGRGAVMIVNMLRFLLNRPAIICIHTYHGHVFHAYFTGWRLRLIKAIEGFFWKRTQAVVVLTSGQGREIVEHLQSDPAPVRVIPLGLDLSSLLAVRKQDLFNQQFGCDFKYWVLWLGRMVSVKNPTRLLRMAQRLCALRDDVAFVMAGDGCEMEQVKSHRKTLGLENRVYLSGWCDSPGAFLAGGSVLINTSDNEGTPVAVMEAIAAGVPVLATAVGGTSEILSGVADCFTFSPEEEEDGVRLLNQCLEKNRRISEEDRKEWVEKFSPSRLADDLENLYRSFLGH